MLLSSASGSIKNCPALPVAEEIALALRQHRHSGRKAAHGLILGLDKYRQLRQRSANLTQGYESISIVIDASQPARVSVF